MQNTLNHDEVNQTQSCEDRCPDNNFLSLERQIQDYSDINKLYKEFKTTEGINRPAESSFYVTSKEGLKHTDIVLKISKKYSVSKDLIYTIVDIVEKDTQLPYNDIVIIKLVNKKIPVTSENNNDLDNVITWFIYNYKSGLLVRHPRLSSALSIAGVNPELYTIDHKENIRIPEENFNFSPEPKD